MMLAMLYNIATVLISSIQNREAKREAEAVRQRLAAAEERAAQLQRENDRLRALLGEAPAGLIFLVWIERTWNRGRWKEEIVLIFNFYAQSSFLGQIF